MLTFTTNTPYKLNRRVQDKRYKNYKLYSGTTGCEMNPKYGLYNKETKGIDLNPYYVPEDELENPLTDQREEILESADFFPNSTYNVVVPRVALMSEVEKENYRFYPTQVNGVLDYDIRGVFEQKVNISLTLPDILLIYLNEYTIEIADRNSLRKFYIDMLDIKEKIEIKMNSSHNSSGLSTNVISLLNDFAEEVFESNKEYIIMLSNEGKKTNFNGSFSNLMKFKTTPKATKESYSGYRRLT